MKTNHNHANPTRERFQPRLSALLADVRALRAELERTLTLRPGRNLVDRQAQRASILDQWIRQAHGPRQLICLACAAEYGVLEQDHLELGWRTVSATADRALRAVYWATVQRWRRVPASNRVRSHTTATAPQLADTGPSRLCEQCHELRDDTRRSSPHAGMLRDECRSDGEKPVDTASWYRCATCSTPWVRREPSHELFAVWSVLRRNSPSATGLNSRLSLVEQRTPQ
ncbi:hypothetical protein [Cupriavidus pinatubonensis]|uniref:hypothetical protein n=1 Tax=Cupriavidus pinatubonensis TaxID=248026 RepID=UPI0036111C35